MSWIDAVIGLSVLAAALRGRASGALRQVGSSVGALSGFVGGLWLSPRVVSSLPHLASRAVWGVVTIVVCAVGGAAVGRALGGLGHRSLRRLRLSSLDATAGAVIAVIQSLALWWLVAGIVVQAAWLPVAGAINQSAIVRTLDVALPPVPSISAQFSRLFDTSNFPSVFASVTEPVLNTVSPGAAPVVNVAASVGKVLSTDRCGAIREGSAFAYGPDEWITNAHVVAGAAQVTVRGVSATLIYFNPADDIAVLIGPRAQPAALGTVVPGPAAVVGFPNNRALTVTPAVVGSVVSAQGRDIYANRLVTRDVVTLAAAVQPGNSGSPVFAAVGGRPVVVAMVFSRSTVQANQAYGIAVSRIVQDVASITRRAAVDSGACLAP